jgi:hypothetical protein|tara:strand:+ start:739 stop:900 length:162 start_codon:yes stop_codon:yes gene_type:complete
MRLNSLYINVLDCIHIYGEFQISDAKMLYVTGRDDLDELAQQVNGCGAPKGFS